MDRSLSITTLTRLCDELEQVLTHHSKANLFQLPTLASSSQTSNTISEREDASPTKTSSATCSKGNTEWIGPPPPILHCRRRSFVTDPTTVLAAVQRRIAALTYNHLGTPFFNINKRASGRSLASVACAMHVACLPIKCLEAVVLAMWMLGEAGAIGIERIPIAFKTRVVVSSSPIVARPGSGDDEDAVDSGSDETVGIYRHIVLAVAVAGEDGESWGALGLSRRPDLMDKPARFPSLAALLDEFIASYNNNYHQVLKVKIGLPAPHDMTTCTTKIAWKVYFLFITSVLGKGLINAIHTVLEPAP
ncbi:Vasohibin-domain-containing protein [Blastocladiella britannica]|nr:Vasohibin-domain-containing protein [Blastocladiella britannica]